jgi:trehalose 6-phosphate synthase
MTADSSFIVVANRLPVRRVEGPEGPRWETSPGGLVSALEPILHERGGTWVGWAGIQDEEFAPFEQGGMKLVPVPLSTSEYADYYEGFSNQTLWPLYHDAIRPPKFRRQWWRPYVQINRRFAEITAACAAQGAMVWVHDYQLQLVPGMLRELRPDLRIGFFLHIPFPPKELFEQLPWRTPILEGLLGADVFGCQTWLGARNFAVLARMHAGARGSGGTLSFADRNVGYGAFPISIDSKLFDRLVRQESVRARAREIHANLGAGRKIVLGIDRLDYTKGIDNRLKAYRELLQDGRVKVENCVLVQTAVPSREQVEQYEDQRATVEQLVGEINGAHGGLGQVAVNYLRKSFPADELAALYSAADVMLVTPLRDGMNLICKEFVATRIEDDGVLVLSEFAGAAAELKSALLVNPHDVDALAATIQRALTMPAGEAARRMRALRRVVMGHDVFDWARSFLRELAA